LGKNKAKPKPTFFARLASHVSSEQLFQLIQIFRDWRMFTVAFGSSSLWFHFDWQ